MSANRRVLIVVPSLAFGGGAERVASVLGTQLLARGVETSFLTFFDPERRYPFSGEERCLRERPSGGAVSKLAKLFVRAWHIARHCRAHGVTTVFSFMEDANFPVVVARVLFRCPARMVVSVRHTVSDYGNGPYARLIRLLYPRADAVVALTAVERANLVAKFGVPAERALVVHNPLDFDKIAASRAEPLGEFGPIFSPDKFIFVTAGRLTKIKNQNLLLEAFRRVRADEPAVRLVLLGDGDLRASLEESAGPDVHFLGNQSNVYRFFARAGRFVLTSFTEAFPNVIIEALACGLPVISTDTQGTREIAGVVGEGVEVVPQEDAQALAAAMLAAVKKTRWTVPAGCSAFSMGAVVDRWEALVR